MSLRRKISEFVRFLGLFGFNPIRTFTSIRRFPAYFSDYREIKRQFSKSDETFVFGRSFPCLGDRNQESGVVRGHYFHQDLLVAQRVYANNPHRHIDVGSRVDGFVAHIASFWSIECVDIRSLDSNVRNIKYIQADMMSELPEDLVGCCDSLSCMHALEHFGLGRYGDPLCFDGHLVGFENLLLMLKPGGKFYFSVPIGPLRIEFNAHRVFSVSYLLEMFEKRVEIEEFSFVDDHGDLNQQVKLTKQSVENNFGCHYGCGIFEMKKLPQEGLQ